MFWTKNGRQGLRCASISQQRGFAGQGFSNLLECSKSHSNVVLVSSLLFPKLYFCLLYVTKLFLKLQASMQYTIFKLPKYSIDYISKTMRKSFGRFNDTEPIADRPYKIVFPSLFNTRVVSYLRHDPPLRR